VHETLQQLLPLLEYKRDRSFREKLERSIVRLAQAARGARHERRQPH